MSVSKANAKSLAVDYASWVAINPEVDSEKSVAMAANALYRSQKISGITLADFENLEYFMSKDPIWKKCFIA